LSQPSLTKPQRRALRELGALAYDRELSAELAKVESEFARWRSGSIDAFELESVIHRFHQGPARKLHSRYCGGELDLLFQVAAALFHGALTERDVPPDLLPVIEPRLAFFRANYDCAEDARSRP